MAIDPGLSRIKAKRELLINGQVIPAGSECVCGDATLAAVCGPPSNDNPNYEMIENGHAQFIAGRDLAIKQPEAKKAK